jgi:photosystem II stability/assembly factor-like uncharacterized protein
MSYPKGLIFASLHLLILISFNESFSQGWFIQTTFNPAQSLQAIRFYNANTGYTTAPIYNSSTYNIHKTTNAGQNWVDQSSGYTATRFMAIWIVHPDTVYISGNYGLIIKTVNGGANWFTLNTGDTTTQFWGLQFVNSFTGYAAGSFGKIMKTTNAGATWVTQFTGVQNAFSCVHFRNENTGYVSGSVIVMKTTNGGTTWFNLNAPGGSFENFREITFTDDNTGYYVSDLGKIQKTTNGGANWTLLSTGTTEALFGIYFTNPNTAYVCGNNGTIIYSTNAGSSWSPQTSPLSEIFTDVWFTSALTGYISTWSGRVLKTTNGGVTFIQPISNEIPSNFKLYQNFPNPFNPSTNIKFDISPLPGGVPEGRGRFVRLTIHDLLGREVAILVYENLNPGNYEVEFDAKDLPSGIYFYKLQAGEFTETKKMSLLK